MNADPDPLPFEPGQPPAEVCCAAGTPPCGFEFLGAKATVLGWLLPCPCCCQGWCALLPSVTDPCGYELAMTAGCSRGCHPEDIAWWHIWRQGELPPAIEKPDRQAIARIRGAVIEAAERIGAAADKPATIKREALAIGALAARVGAPVSMVENGLAVAAAAAGCGGMMDTIVAAVAAGAGCSRERREAA